MVEKLLARDFFISKYQSITIEPRTPQINFPEHTHDFDEIVIVTSGEGRHIINGRPEIINQGTILYIDANDHHSYENVRDLYLTNILFQSYDNFKFLKNIGLLINDIKKRHLNSYYIPIKELAKIEVLIKQLQKIGNNNTLQEEITLLQMLCFLHQYQFSSNKSLSLEEKFQQLLHFLYNNFYQNICWDNLSEQFGIPLRTLNRYMRSYKNCTPTQFLNKLRLAESYYQLCYSDKAIIDIAYECGFNDSGYFATLFRKEFGMSPSVLRNCDK